MKKMLMMCTAALFAMGLELAASAATGDCEEHATSIGVGESKTVKLVNEWDSEWQETTGNPVHVLKIVCKKGKGYTVTVSGSGVSFYVDVPWSYDDDAPWFDYDVAGTSAMLHESSWESDYPGSIDYYVYVSGESIGDSVNVSFEGNGPDGGPYTETVDGITWTYVVSGGKASVGGDGGGCCGARAVPTSTTGAITIPSVLGEHTVTSIGNYAFDGCSGLTSVTIPSSVTSIGDCAFRFCGGLTSVTIPSSVTSIEDEAFEYCSGLTSVTILEGVTSIGRQAFSQCSGLTSVTIPSSVTNIGAYAFSGSALTNVTIPSSVTSIGWGAFYGCSAMSSYSVDPGNMMYKSKNGLLLSKSGEELIFGINGDVTIPEGVTSIGDYAFSGRSGLRSVVIPEGVTGIGNGAFSECSGLTSVVIPEGVTNIGSSVFCGCSGLTSVVIPEGVTNIGNSAFGDCSGLASVTIPEGVTSIGDFAFGDCSGLTSVVMPEGVTSIGDYAFSGCSGLTSVTIPNSVTSIGRSAFSGCSGLTSVTIPEGVTSIGYEAFSGCSGLTGVTIPSSVTSIGDGAFGCCAGLMSFYVDPGNMMYKSKNGLLLSKSGDELIFGINGDVTIPNGVTSIGSSAFSGCSGLTRVKIPSSVTSIGYYAFANCGLTSVVIPEGVIDICQCAFNQCYSLTSVTLPSSVTNIGDEAFAGCYGLTSITIPEGVIKIGYESFAHCSGLKSVVMFEGVTEIDYGAFNGCYQANVTIPSSVTKIGDLAFCGCKGLTVNSGNVKYCSVDGVLYNKSKTILICCSTGRTGDFVIPSGVQCIRDRAFNECRGVRSVTIPASVTDIGECVFDNCQELKSFVVDPENATYQSVNNLLLRKDDLELIAGVNGAVSIPLGVTGIGENAFYWRTGLTSVSIPSSVAWIGERAFCCCRNLTRVTLPEGLTDIGEFAFAGCSSLTRVTISEGLTDIGEYAFGGCSSLMQVTIPASVEWIGEYAFSGCNKLTSVYVDEGDEDRVREMLEDSGFDTTDVTFLVIGDEPIYEVISGAKTDIDVGLVGYKATGLPKGLTLNAKGHVTGATKAEGEYEVTFTKKGEEDETAVFVVRKESAPTLECEALEAGSFTVGVAGAAGGMPIAISAESGVKSVAQKNLPAGMKLEQDKTTKQWLVTGAPTKAGPCKVKLTVTTVAGNKVEKEFEIAVATLPDMVVGTFNGFVSQRKQYDAEFGKPFGAIQVTTTDAGKITAKITAAAKTYSFSATCWDEVKDGVYSVNVTLKTGEALSLMLDSSAGWDVYQLTGRFSFAGTPSDGSYYELSAQRNAFGKTWYFDVEGSEADGWRFSYADNPKTAALTLSLNADGKTSIAGKLGDLRVSASGYSDVSEMRNGCVIADFAPVVTVMDNKKSVKMLLAIRTNLWFDRSNDHELIGSAELVR